MSISNLYDKMTRVISNIQFVDLQISFSKQNRFQYRLQQLCKAGTFKWGCFLVSDIASSVLLNVISINITMFII